MGLVHLGCATPGPSADDDPSAARGERGKVAAMAPADDDDARTRRVFGQGFSLALPDGGRVLSGADDARAGRLFDEGGLAVEAADTRIEVVPVDTPLRDCGKALALVTGPVPDQALAPLVYESPERCALRVSRAGGEVLVTVVSGGARKSFVFLCRSRADAHGTCDDARESLLPLRPERARGSVLSVALPSSWRDDERAEALANRAQGGVSLRGPTSMSELSLSPLAHRLSISRGGCLTPLAELADAEGLQIVRSGIEALPVGTACAAKAVDEPRETTVRWFVLSTDALDTSWLLRCRHAHDDERGERACATFAASLRLEQP